MVCLSTTKTVRAFLDRLEADGCEVVLDLGAGTAVATDDGLVVYRALQKGRGQPWIVRCMDSARINWAKPELSAAVYAKA